MDSGSYDVSTEENIFLGALALFLVAGATGTLFRFQLAYGWEGPLELANVRHAHSHLMYFGWGTPALMALIWYHLPSRATGPYHTLFRWVAGWIFVSALLSYPLFLLFGYSPVQVGGARLPIAVVGATLNIFGWYGFAGLYLVVTKGLRRSLSLRLWDLALFGLLLSTLGAWGLPLLKPLGFHDPLWTQALIHVFLDLFSEGWFVLGMLGLAYAGRTPEGTWLRSWPLWLVVLGVPVTFLLALPAAELSVAVEWIGRAGGVLVGTGLLVLAVPLLRIPSGETPRWIWGLPLAFLVLKGSAQLAGSLIPDLWLGENHGLRILYLHLMLLGFLTLGLAAAAWQAWRPYDLRDMRWFHAAVAMVLASLVLLTPWGPLEGGGAYRVAAWVAGLPVLAGGVLFARGFSTKAGSRPPSSTRRRSDP